MTSTVRVVLDTNIVLDLFVFHDARAVSLRSALHANQVQWIATVPMREELQLVLQYPHIATRMQQQNGSADQVLALFDALAEIQPVAAKAPVTCKDTDDQKFIDLAVAHQAHLWSKDHAIMCLHKRLLVLGVTYCVWP